MADLPDHWKPALMLWLMATLHPGHGFRGSSKCRWYRQPPWGQAEVQAD